MYNEISAYMEDHPEDMVNSVDEAIVKAEEENYVFFTEASTIEYVARRHCSLTQYGSWLDERSYGIAIRSSIKNQKCI